MVFSESIKQRLETAKAKFEKENESHLSETIQDETKMKFKEILRMNNIDIAQFIEDAYKT